MNGKATASVEGETGDYSSITVNGVKLHYESRGGGPHALLFVPGAMGTPGQYELQLKEKGADSEWFPSTPGVMAGHAICREPGPWMP